MNWYKRSYNENNYFQYFYNLLINPESGQQYINDVLIEVNTPFSLQALNSALQKAQYQIQSQQGGRLDPSQMDIIRQINGLLSGVENPTQVTNDEPDITEGLLEQEQAVQ